MALHKPAASGRDFVAERAAVLKLLVESKKHLRLVLAGPGSGKTFSFGQALTDQPHANQVLTFIRLLVADMAPALNTKADVQTFHSYAVAVLHQIGAPTLTNAFRVYPQLPRLVERELGIVLGRQAFGSEVERELQTLDIGEASIVYLALGSYYDAVSFVDVVYRLYQRLCDSPALIPHHELLVVDEVQDFTRLEIELIHTLGESSPVLAAGDDDQAIYGRRHASPEFVRLMARGGKWEVFELPFCSRCTPVIVGAVCDVLHLAASKGLLQGRLQKPFECYLPDKKHDGDRYPKIKVVECTVDRPASPMPSRYVLDEIGRIPGEDIAASHEGSGYPTVLIIGTRNFTDPVVEALVRAGYVVRQRQPQDPEIDILEGYLILRESQYSRLGWRIVAECDTPPDFSEAVRVAVTEQRDLRELIPNDYVTRHLAIVGLLDRIANGDQLTEAEVAAVESATDHSIDEVRQKVLPPAPVPDEEPDKAKPTILVTTYVGAKGLSGGHVFMLGMNVGFLPRREKVTDEDVRLFVVGLTRTRKECHLVWVKWYGVAKGKGKKPKLLHKSPLLNWLAPASCTSIVADARYFKKRSVTGVANAHPA
jgi:ATP-dependent DNA helicase UvrD/PcrA